MDQILKFPWVKYVGLFFIVTGSLWYVGFRIPIFNYEPGPDGYIPYYSPNCAYYVLYRQSLWEKIADPYPWGMSTAFLYEKTGKLLFSSKTSPGDNLMPIWISGPQNSALQGDARKWWEYHLPASPGDRWNPQNCLAQEK